MCVIGTVNGKYNVDAVLLATTISVHHVYSVNLRSYDTTNLALEYYYTTSKSQRKETAYASDSTGFLDLSDPLPVILSLIAPARFFSPSLDHFDVRAALYCITPRWRISSCRFFSSSISFCSFFDRSPFCLLSCVRCASCA